MGKHKGRGAELSVCKMSEFRDSELAWAWSCAEARNDRICELLEELSGFVLKAATQADAIAKQMDLLRRARDCVPEEFAAEIDSVLIGHISERTGVCIYCGGTDRCDCYGRLE